MESNGGSEPQNETEKKYIMKWWKSVIIYIIVYKNMPRVDTLPL